MDCVRAAHGHRMDKTGGEVHPLKDAVKDVSSQWFWQAPNSKCWQQTSNHVQNMPSQRKWLVTSRRIKATAGARMHQTVGLRHLQMAGNALGLRKVSDRVC